MMKIARGLLHCALSTAMVASGLAGPVARAEGAPALNSAERELIASVVSSPKAEQLISPKLSVNKINESLKHNMILQPLQATVGVGQTMLMMMMLAGVSMMAQEISHEGLTPQTISPAHLEHIANLVSVQVLNNGALWAGLIGSSVTASVGSKPAKIISSVFAQGPLKKTLLLILPKVLLNTVAFVGWDLGSQLWIDASLQIKDPADYKRTQSLGDMGSGLLRSLKSSASTSDLEEARVAKEMLGNMTSILIWNSGLRNEWLNNAWRLRIATGPFATLLTSTIVSGAIGTALFPAGGTAVGLTFGLAGGIFAQIVPMSAKDEMTIEFKEGRRDFVNLHNDLTGFTIGQLIHPGLFAAWSSQTDRAKRIQNLLHVRRRERSSFLTVAVERAIMSVESIGKAKPNNLQLATQKNSRLIKVLTRRVNEFLDNEETQTSIWQNQTFGLRLTELDSSWNEEKNRIQTLKDLMDDLLAQLESLDSNSLAHPTEDLNQSLRFLEDANERGFNEELIMAKAKGLT